MVMAASVVGSLEEQHRFYVSRLKACGGDRFLDAGCGIGRTLLVAQLEMPGSRWIGVDRMEGSVRTAVKSLSTAEANVQLLVGDIQALPFPDGAFDSLISRDTLECVADPPRVLNELARVVRPGGVVLICHWDWDTAIYNCADLELTRRVTAAFADAKQEWMERIDPAMGRKLRGLVVNSGLLELVEAGVLVMLETECSPGHYGFDMAQDLAHLVQQQDLLLADNVRRWMRLLEEAAAQRNYFFSANHYWCLARRRAMQAVRR